MDYKKNLRHIIGQRVAGYLNSKVLDITEAGIVVFEYVLADSGVKCTAFKDLAEIKIVTVTGH